MKENSDEALNSIEQYQESQTDIAKKRQTTLIPYNHFSLAINHAETILNHLNGKGDVTSEIYDYARSLPISEMIYYTSSYKINLCSIPNHYNTEIGIQVESIFKLIDNTKDRALGYNLFTKEIINKVPYDIEASSVIPLLLYKIKTLNNIESIRVAAEFICELSDFLTNDWIVKSAIYIAQREIPSTIAMQNLGKSIICLSYNSKNANKIIGAYFNEIENYKTTAGKIATIKITENFISKLAIKNTLYSKAISIMESYIGDEDIKFQSVKVILDIFHIKESLNPDNKDWPVRLANAVRLANYKYKFIDTHPFLEKARDGDQPLSEKVLEEVFYINKLEHCPEGYYNCNNEVDLYIVNNFDG